MTLESAARAVLEGATSSYGEAWRQWAGNPAASPSTQAYGAALLALEAAVDRLDDERTATLVRVLESRRELEVLLGDQAAPAGRPRPLGRVAAKLRVFRGRRRRAGARH